MAKRITPAGALLLSVLLAACGGGTDTDDTPTPTPGAPAAPLTYEFVSDAGESTVSYSGQTFRQVLISDLKSHIAGLTARIDGGSFTPTDGDVLNELLQFYEFDDSVAADMSVGINTQPATRQATFADISSGKDLRGKIAGRDEVGQHKDWSTEFVGWEMTEVTTPDSLVFSLFGLIDAAAVDRAAGLTPQTPDGAPVDAVYVTESGVDLLQITQKFLDGAVSFSQASDDYLDDDIEGKGLLASNAIEEGALYSDLAHAWDEGFGYFGAARDYGDYTLDELTANGGRDGWSNGYHDSNDDGAIDLKAEFNFGHSVTAAKRDRGAISETHFTEDAFGAFVRGRAIIAEAGDTLTADELAALKAERDTIVYAWESALSATVVHYINETLADMSLIGSGSYDFHDHAKHWSEMKGYALALQFNPRSPLSDADFTELHKKLGSGPALPVYDDAATIEAYRQELIAARALLASAYAFDSANIGDDDGGGGW